MEQTLQIRLEVWTFSDRIALCSKIYAGFESKSNWKNGPARYWGLYFVTQDLIWG